MRRSRHGIDHNNYSTSLNFRGALDMFIILLCLAMMGLVYINVRMISSEEE
jgi:uncharacterized membrane protein affecting hemolysin expression